MPDVRSQLLLILVTAPAMASCRPERPEQINLIIQMETENPATVRQLVQSAARRTGMRVNEDVLTFGRVRYLLSDGSRSVMIGQSMDDCPESNPAGVDPCFSKTRYQLSIFRTSWVGPGKPLSPVARAVAQEARKVGGRVYPNPQAVQGSRPR